jgi:hypothetical protein
MVDEGLTAGTLIDGARMYAASADAVNDQYPNALHVLSHLLGMSIELALKAYLKHAGCSAHAPYISASLFRLRRMRHLKREIVYTYSIPTAVTCRNLRLMTTTSIPLHKEVLQWFGECTRELGLAPLAPIS